MKEALILSREDYKEGLEKIEDFVKQENKSYLDGFTVEFPDGLNTASALEICRIMQDPSLDAKVHLMRLCILKKVVKVTCPNGDKESFCISELTDSLDGFELFKNEPLALSAIADSVYGHILKKSLRLSKPGEPVAAQTSKE